MKNCIDDDVWIRACERSGEVWHYVNALGSIAHTLWCGLTMKWNYCLRWCSNTKCLSGSYHREITFWKISVYAREGPQKATERRSSCLKDCLYNTPVFYWWTLHTGAEQEVGFVMPTCHHTLHEPVSPSSCFGHKCDTCAACEGKIHLPLICKHTRCPDPAKETSPWSWNSLAEQEMFSYTEKNSWSSSRGLSSPRNWCRWWNVRSEMATWDDVKQNKQMQSHSMTSRLLSYQEFTIPGINHTRNSSYHSTPARAHTHSSLFSPWVH